MFGIKTAAKNAVKALRAKEILPVQKIVDSDRALEGKVAFIAGGSGGIWPSRELFLSPVPR